MNTKEIIEKLSKFPDSRSFMSFVFELKFKERFNTLREILYHIDIFLAEKKLDQAKQMLDVGDKLNDMLDAGHKFDSTDDFRNYRTLRIIGKKKVAKYLEAKGDYPGAAAQYRKILEDLHLPDEEAFNAEIMMEIGILEEQSGKKKDAIVKFEKAAEIYKNKKDDFNYQAALFNSAHVLYDLKQYRQAEVFCKYVIKHYGETGKIQSPAAHAYLEMANICEIREKDQDAKGFYDKALDSYRKLNERTKISDILNRIASYQMDSDQPELAEKMLQESLDLKQSIDYHQGKANFLFVVAESLRESGNLFRALDYYNMSYQQFTEAGVESKKLQIKHSIYKCLKALKMVKKDMGTFIEKFELKPPNIFTSEKAIRLDYRSFGTDGYNLSNHQSWKFSERPRVNRKFLVYLLRNLTRVYIKLGKDKEYFKYQNLLNIVESDYKKNK
ncbi:MAG: tetratricopeptide repeat protein [Firmicutes bacterium]|nr:tetratricopeptide repeat protein [Bacillota bacterium]